MKIEKEQTSGFLRRRIVQIHPTLKCNLRCEHCYSSSGPGKPSGIEAALFAKRLSLLRSHGYEVVSISGGEPFVYSGLETIVHEARRIGFAVNLITNGTLLASKKAQSLLPRLSSIGLSIDGRAATHDRLRGNGAFNRAMKGLEILRDQRGTFGIAHCVTKSSIQDLPWLAQLCIDNGASLLQLHPLVDIGRGQSINAEALDAAEQARVFLISESLKVAFADRLQIQLDIAPVEEILKVAIAQHSFVKSGKIDNSHRSEVLSDFVNPIVVDESGMLWPMAYGMSEQFRIASADFSLWRKEIRDYMDSRAETLANLIVRTLDHIKSGNAEFVDWYQLMCTLSWSAENRSTAE